MPGNTVKMVFSGDASKLDKAMKDVGSSADKMAADVGKASDKLGASGETGAKKFGDGLSKLKVGAAGAGALAAAGLGKAFAGALDISAGNAKLAGQFGLSKDQAAMAGQAAGGVFATGMTDSMAEAQEAVKAVGTSMLDLRTAPAAAVQDLSTRAMLLSKTFDIDVNDATRGAGKLMKEGLAKDGVEAFDLITRSMQVSGDASGDLLDTVNEYSPFLKNLGISGAEAFGSLGAAQKLGIRDTDAWGDAIKEFSLRAIDGSKTTVDAYKSLGLNAKKMGEDIAAGGPKAETAMSQVVRALQGVKDPVEQNRIGVELFGTQWEDTARGILPALDPLANKLGDVQGATDRMNDATTTAQQKVDALKNKFTLWSDGLVNTQGPLGDVAAGVMAFGPDALDTLEPLGQMLVALKMKGAVDALKGVGSEVEGVGRKAETAGGKAEGLRGKLAKLALGGALLYGTGAGLEALGGDDGKKGTAPGSSSGDQMKGSAAAAGKLFTGDFGGFGSDFMAQVKAAPVQFEATLAKMRNDAAGFHLTPMSFEVNLGPAQSQVDGFLSQVNGATPQVNINGNNQPAGNALRTVLGDIAAGKESVTIDGQSMPAQEALSWVEGLINQSDGTVTINGQTVPAGQALADILGRTARSSASIGVGADTSGAQWGVDQFIRMNNGRRINIVTTTLGSGGIASAPRLASGGPVQGPGSGTSDTAGLFALSNGEYVMTAGQVQAAGGFAGMGRLAAALDRGPAGLAAGGPASAMHVPTMAALRVPQAAAGGSTGGGRIELVVAPGADGLMATAIMKAVRTGQIQLRPAR